MVPTSRGEVDSASTLHMDGSSGCALLAELRLDRRLHSAVILRRRKVDAADVEQRNRGSLPGLDGRKRVLIERIAVGEVLERDGGRIDLGLVFVRVQAGGELRAINGGRREQR